jgi:N-acylglucosamine 2-epimerase
MMKTDLKLLAEKCHTTLLNNVIPFWEKHSPDKEHGGYFTCLDRFGKVYDTDKFMWLQGRQAWMFASLYNNLEKKESWLHMAESGVSFMEKHGMDNEGNWYFSLTRDGKPLIAPYNISSDIYAAMAFGQLSKATGSDRYANIAVDTFKNIIHRSDNPKGIYTKAVAGTRPLISFSLPMDICYLALEIEHLLEKDFLHQTIDRCIHEIMEVFYDVESGFILENVNPDGSLSDTFEGRLLNPGNAIQAMWFIMDLAERKRDKELAGKAVKITLDILKHSWDKEFGGIFYFLDIKGHPVQQLEWDQKLWWVHIETLVSLIKGYHHTKNQECLDWFKKVNDYTWSHFPDPQYGEWFGYLNRRGEVLLPLKGGKWKGCFHVPRGLYQISKTIDKIL